MQEEDLVAYVYTESGNTGMTEQMIRIPIIPREKPTPAYTPEQVDNYGALVIELVDTIEKIETMKREAQEILDRAREAIGVAEAWTNVSATAKTLPTGAEPTVTVTQNAEGQHQIEFGIPMGQTGEQGDAGSGVAPDGKDGQMLVKDGDGDYKTKWQDVPKMVNTINGQWGDITLTNEVISEIYHPPVESVNGMTGEVK